MANYNNKSVSNNSLGKGEIIYKNHTLEFLRFFESHKRLCDVLSGLKYHTINDLDGGDKIVISRINFELGIRKLNSFIIDYLHYIDEVVKIDEIKKKFVLLESEFINDDEYHDFVRKKDNLSTDQNISFNRKYINYLVKAFDVSFLMSKYLQKSLNIASKEVIKTIQFANYDGFFNNLSGYREEVANDLSNLSFGSLFDNFKKLLGYFYTYRYLIGSRSQKHINDLLRLIHSYITLDETVRIIIKKRDKAEFSSSLKLAVRGEITILREAFNKVYFLCNRSLSLKNILPKSKSDVLEDTTLI